MDNNNGTNQGQTPSTIDQRSASTDTFMGSQSYGWYRYKPKCLQRFCTAKWALFWLCWGGAMQGLIVNGFINVVITTIERRFGLRSRQTGLVASGYDIASFLCLVPVTYFGGRLGASKPRIIAWGIILLGMGSLTFALPHFLVGPYRATTPTTGTCNAGMDDSNITLQVRSIRNFTCDIVITDITSNRDYIADETDGGDNLSWTVWLFFAAQLLHGAGASPLFTLGVTYIDENVSKKMSSVYLGTYYTMTMLGPAVGYVLGGQLLLIYTDFLQIDVSELSLTSASKVWIGAWWIGFVFAAIACFILAIPIFGYPTSLPGSEKLQQEKISEAYNANKNVDQPTAFTKFKELPMALTSLLKNPTFVFLNLAGASEGMIIAGFAAFLPKQIENQFSISPVWSALLMGLITVPAGGGGTFLGGYLVKKFNLNCAGIIRLCLVVTIIATVFTSCFLLSCPNLKFAGVTTGYRKTSILNESQLTKFTIELEADCNANCSCSKYMYDPICGQDNVMYYNPCYAGCSIEIAHNESKSYRDCGCIKSTTPEFGFEATNTMCSSSCQYLPYFVALCFILMLFTFLATMPALSATLRCVYDDQRSFALGIQWIKVRLLGTIPAPMIFGTLIDETCILWQETCDEQAGACLVYENSQMSRYMWMLALTGKLCSVVFFFAAWWFYIPPKQVLPPTDDSTNPKDDINSTSPISTVESVMVVTSTS
ncbi:solute carrier organic anion transporter family member 4A1 [Musca vetustissima]|uniref:solute carrier organic anion transporter family member 4A1 n=1 Tax=Musca vetustissima TaxID=27455 RepID=UPI002AB71B55|nr:solute carrier organic anion transporter family member 4A1 [Musca vetustissima]